MSQPSTPSPERAAQGDGKQIPVEGAVSEETTPQETEVISEDNPSQNDSEQVPSAGLDDQTEGDTSSSDVSEASGEEEVLAEAAEVIADAVEDELAKAVQEARDWQDKFLRLHAEWDTYRRRTAEQRELEKARATEKLVEGLLPVIDDFERTIDYAQNNGETGLLDGVKAVHSKFVGVLEKDGVQVIDPAGEEFNALEAQAVATVENTDVFDETVNEVYQKGYKMGEKVLRPAMVTVTTGGPKREKPQEEAE